MLNKRTKKLSIFMMCLFFLFATIFLSGCNFFNGEEVTDIQVSTINDKVYINKEFDTNNVLVIAEYADGSFKTILNTFVKFSSIDTSTVGIKTLVVSYGGKSKSLQIKVVKPEYNFNIEQTGNGTITPENPVVIDGENQEFAITPNEGYFVDKLIVDDLLIDLQNDKNLTYNKNGGYNYTFSNVKKPHTLKATFKIKTYQITTSVGKGGTITPQNQKVNYNENATFKITPNDGYIVDELIVDNVRVNLQNDANLTDNKNGNYTYIFNKVTKLHSLYVTFYQKGTEGLSYQGLNANGEKTNENSEIVSYAVTKYTGTEPNVIIPNKYNRKVVTKIDKSAFLECAILENILIPNSVTNIEDYAFGGCISLSSITIPSSVKVIGKEVFSKCDLLKTFKVEKENINYKDDNGRALLTKNGKILMAYAYASGINYTIPESVTAIYGYVFYECDSLENVVMLNNITTIGDECFAGCKNLKNITLSNALTKIEFGTFNNCSSLTHIIIPSSVIIIDNYVFKGCTSLANITIPSAVTKIGQNTFDGCISLSSITIPSSVTIIGDATFNECKSLNKVIIDSAEVAKVASGDSTNYLLQFATTVYVKENIKEVSLQLQNNYVKQATSDKQGYVKYTRK